MTHFYFKAINFFTDFPFGFLTAIRWRKFVNRRVTFSQAVFDKLWIINIDIDEVEIKFFVLTWLPMSQTITLRPCSSIVSTIYWSSKEIIENFSPSRTAVEWSLRKEKTFCLSYARLMCRYLKYICRFIWNVNDLSWNKRRVS